MLTLKALISLPLTRISSSGYSLCRDPKCPTVYYSADGSQLFGEEALRERVYQKHPDEDTVFACDIRNPLGSCCLGNVRLLVKELQQAT